MKFARAGFFSEFRNIPGVQPGARQDDDARAGKLDELAQCFATFGSTTSSAGGEQARNTRGNDVFEGAGKIVGVVEGAVESDFEGMREFDEFPSAFDVDGIVGAKNAEDQAFHAEVASKNNVAAHGGKFGIGIDKIALARANDRKHWNFEILVDLAHGGNRGSDTALIEFAAEFNAIGSGVFGG